MYILYNLAFSSILGKEMSVIGASVSADGANSVGIKSFVLKNGLTIWLNEDHSQPKVFGAVVVKAGAKDCPDTGIAHYFEHMMFKGTDKIGTTDFVKEKVFLDAISEKYDELSQTENKKEREKIQKEINLLSIQAADYVVLTLGTAWVYRLEGGRVAANCHKMPQRLFTRSRMSVEETVEVLTRAIEGPLAGRHVILTVSPVRHVGDGLAGNSLSKAVLRVAAGCLAERYEQVDYFPAFEILNDDLRDYRFYDADMVHPSPVAVQYVWEQWLACAVAPESQRPAAEAERLSTAMRHRPLDPGSEAHSVFCRSMLDRVERLEREYPGIDWSRWRRYFSAES